MEKRGKLRKYKKDSSRVWEKNKCRSKMIGEAKYGRRKRL